MKELINYFVSVGFEPKHAEMMNQDIDTCFDLMDKFGTHQPEIVIAMYKIAKNRGLDSKYATAIVNMAHTLYPHLTSK